MVLVECKSGCGREGLAIIPLFIIQLEISKNINNAGIQKLSIQLMSNSQDNHYRVKTCFLS